MSRAEISIGNIRWVHINQPSADDIAFVRNAHSFDEIVISYISSPTLHPSLEEFGDNVYFILHFPIIYTTDERNKTIEIDFLMTKNTLITFTYEKYERLETLFNRCEQDQALRNTYFRSHSGYILYFILEQLYQAMIRDRDYIEESIDTLEQDVFSTADETLIERISSVARDVLDFRRVFKMQGSVMGLLPQALEKMLGKESIPKFTNIVIAHDRIVQLMDSHKETIDSLQTTNASLVDKKISHIVKTLTIFSAILLPLSLIAGIWGMNHEFIPLRDGPNDFWIVLALMALLTGTLLLIFKRSKWF